MDSCPCFRILLYIFRSSTDSTRICLYNSLRTSSSLTAVLWQYLGKISIPINSKGYGNFLYFGIRSSDCIFFICFKTRIFCCSVLFEEFYENVSASVSAVSFLSVIVLLLWDMCLFGVVLYLPNIFRTISQTLFDLEKYKNVFLRKIKPTTCGT